MIKGNQREDTNTERKLYTGFTTVKVAAINPTRAELNKLLNREGNDTDTEFVYTSTDQDGNERVRLTFWLKDETMPDKYWIYSFNLTDKVRVSKDGIKTQFVNSVCMTGWADEPDNLANWFTKFLDKDKEEIGDKEFRPALLGEEELATLLRSWLGKMSWNDPESGVMVDVKALINEDYAELRNQIDGKYDVPFTILTGVRTDENDSTKQYQQIYGKAFLPAGFLGYIKKGKFPTDYSQKVWKRFEEDVTGEYGFNSYFELVPLKEYNKEDDIAAAETTVAEPKSKKY